MSLEKPLNEVFPELDRSQAGPGVCELQDANDHAVAQEQRGGTRVQCVWTIFQVTCGRALVFCMHFFILFFLDFFSNFFILSYILCILS